MMFYEFRILATGVIIGYVISKLSNDYIIVSKRKFEKRNKENKQ